MHQADQARTLWPLPGGSGSYLASMRRMLAMAAETPRTAELSARVVQAFELTSAKAAASYVRVLHTLGFLEVVATSVYLTEAGRAERAQPSDDRVRDALLLRVAGCAELLEILRPRPLQMSAILTGMQAAGFAWTTQTQVRYRLRWLEELGEVERLGVARPEYRLTGERGRGL